MSYLKRKQKMRFLQNQEAMNSYSKSKAMNSYTMFWKITLHLIPFKLFLFSVILSASFVNTDFLALPGCPGKCGNLSIPFPFGTTSDCYLDDSFLIVCNSSFNPPKPFLQLGSAEVLSISLDGKIKILNSSSELMGLEKRDRDSVPMVIEWAAGNAACHVARDDSSRYACQSLNSQCKDSSIGRGHICHCLPGYQGNPYLVDGCQDIDECAVSKPCREVCINLPGSFKCYCPEGFIGDGRKDGKGCHPKPKDQINWSASIYFLIGIFVLAPVLASTWLLKIKEKTKLRLNTFARNGGNLLESRLKKSASTQLRIYTAEDVKRATNNYSDTSVMQRCNPGTFYRGTLVDSDNVTEVVIMKTQRVPESQIEQFVDQLIFLSQPHRNLVKIMGCCLETGFPLLVYELHGDGNGNLFDCIRDEALVSRFSCEMRIKAAAGAARGLAYLQSQNSRAALVHGNISSGNILLDDSFDAKVFYAVASSLIPRDISSSEPINGVYEDPEFISSGRLDKKNDVYSFGVVLAELLRGGKAFAPDRQEIDRNLALNFMSLVKEGNLSEILDDQLMSEEDACLVKEVAMVAARCLSVKPGKRPKMKEVEAKLSALMKQLRRDGF